MSRSVHASNFAGIGVSVETAAKLFHIMDANQVWGVGCFGAPFFYTGLPRGAIFEIGIMNRQMKKTAVEEKRSIYLSSQSIGLFGRTKILHGTRN